MIARVTSESDVKAESPLFPAVSEPAGSSIVLLTTAVNSDQVGPSAFADLGIAKPQNFISAADLIVIDYGGFQCLVLPGEPVRMQVQVAPGRQLREAVEYARRFFGFAAGPRA